MNAPRKAWDYHIWASTDGNGCQAVFEPSVMFAQVLQYNENPMIKFMSPRELDESWGPRVACLYCNFYLGLSKASCCSSGSRVWQTWEVTRISMLASRVSEALTLLAGTKFWFSSSSVCEMILIESPNQARASSTLGWQTEKPYKAFPSEKDLAGL